MATKSQSKMVGGKQGRAGRFASGISSAALAIACVFPTSVSAETYAVSNATELQDAITAANANTADPSATITLTASFAATNLPTPTKSITIDTQGFTLSGTPTLLGPSGPGSLTFIGTIAGASGAPASATAGKVGLLVTSGSLVTNSGTVSGGDGGSGGGQAERGARVYDPNSVLTNNGTISAGMNYSGSIAISGVTISNGGTLINNGAIQGAGSQSASALAGSGVDMGTISRSDTLINTGTIRGGTGTGGALGGAGVTMRLNNQPIVNTGTIEGGNGAVAVVATGSAKVSLVNSGTLRAGTGQANALQMGTGTLMLELQAGSTIQGNVVASTTNLNDILRLGGATNATFDVSLIGAATQYQNFDIFQKTGTGTWALAGTGAATTSWSIQQGTLQIGSGSTTGSIIGDVTNNGTLAFSRSNTLSYAGLISGTGAVTQIGSGTTILTGTNSYTGGTTIAAGTLQLGAGGTTGSILGNVVNNGTLTFSRSDASTFAGAITGTGSVNSISGGTTTLTGNSNYSGATNASGGGEIRIAGGATVTSGFSSLISSARLTVDGAGTVFNVATITAQSGGGVASTVNVQNGGVLHTTGNMVVRNSPAGPVLTTLNVSGTGSSADIGGALTVATSGNTQIAGVNVSAGGKLKTAQASSMGAAVGNSTAPFITITGAGSDWTSTNSLAITNGALSLLNGATASFTTVTAGSVSAAFPAVIVISGTDSHLTTTGDLVIGSGAGTGSLTLADGGQASVGGSLLLGNGGTSTGILNIGGAESQAAAGIGTFGATALVFGGTGSRINFNHNDPAYSFATLLSGAGAVNQVAGTTILSANNSYSGTTTVSGGTLRINGDQSAATGLTNVLSGGRLGGSGKIGGNVTIASGGTLAPGNSPGTITIAGDLTLNSGSLLDYEFGQSNVIGGPLNDLTRVGGNLVLDGTINVTVTAGGNFDPGVYRVISYGGTLTNNGLSVGTIPGGSVVAVQTSAPGQVNLVNSAGATLNFWDGAAGPKNNSIVNGGNGSWQASIGNDNWTDVTAAINAGYSDGAFAIFSATPGNVTVDNSQGAVTASGMQFVTSGYTIGGGPLTLTGPQAVIRVGDGTADGSTYTARIDAQLAGASQLVKTDLGSLILNGANTYTGGTAINAGTLQIAGDANLGDAAGGLTFNGGVLHTTASFGSSRGVDFASTGTIDTDAATALNLDGVLSGPGALVKQGSGRLILTADNVYTGETTIGAGTLQIGNGGTTGSIIGNVTNNGALAFDRSDTITFAGTISGTGTLGQIGGGTTILTGANSYTGGTTIGAGTLQVGDGGTSGSIAGNVIDNSVLAFNRSDNVTFGGTISGSGVVTNAGPGTTLLTGTSTYGGATQVDAGILLINGNQSAATGLTSVASGATLGGTGTIGGTVTVADGGVLAPGSNGAGTLHIGGNLTLAATSQLDFQFGQAGTVGGALNDLVDVAGNLTLDGTINVAATPAGSFGAGLYRIANYGGTLTDNGLSVGTLPSGFDASVQTSVLQQVNLIATASTPPGGGSGGSTGGLSFWDGAAGPKANGVINGGNGVWQNGTGNDNWTSSTGAANARYADGTLAIFAAAPGTVTVDDSLGAVTASGLQFASDGYRVTGDTLTLTGTQAAIRVGDGTAAGAGYTATVSAVLSGGAQLAKTDLGALILTGANSYSGGTLVQSGTLLINGDSSAATGATNVASGATLGGTGTIGGNVAFANGGILAPGSKAPGTLTIKGDLSLGAGTQLAYELGQANAAGGALNDLVDVGGNLVLDGNLNVSVPAGGAFGVGVYRLFNYGGALTDHGLTLGTLPATGVTVQTSVAGQVNVVNGAGLALNFWDGTAPRGDNIVGGGSGTWQNGTGHDNWTDANGAINGAYTDGAFAIFGGTGGTVTVDTSLGAINSAGMQFAANGYTIGGATITLTSPQSIIRVGDGTAAGAQFSTTIGATLGGAAQLVKTDLGTLILGGTNSYSGGTLINAGTLQIASDANLGAAAGGVTLDGGTLATSADLTSARNVALAGAGAISTASGTTFTLSGALSGGGVLTKAGAGTLRLTGDNSAYAGATAVSGGTLDVRGAIGGTMTVATATRLEGTGRIGSVTNAGTIAPGGADLGMLTVVGNYAGNGGTLEIASQLGGDVSLTDRLVVNGGTSGTTQVTVANRGGLGAQTIEGVKIVDVAGASDGVFVLRGDYVFQGDQAVIAGAYGYRLYKGGVTTPSDGDWYLRSTLLNPIGPPQTPDTPLYQPGVPIYEVYPSTLLLLNGIDTMQQRTGDRGYSTSSDGRSNGIWGRMEGQRFRPNAVSSTSGADADYNSWKAEIGADHVLAQTARGATLTGSLSARYGKASAQVNSLFGNGSVKTRGYGARAALTWQDQAGFYADAQAQFSWYDSDLNSSVLGKLARGNDGKGQAYGLELGQRVAFGGVTVTPQLQVVYSKVRFDPFTDPAGADISLGKAGSFKTRWGIAIEHRSGLSRIYAVGNLTYDWLGDTATEVSGTPIARSDYRLWSGISVGGSIGVNDRLSLYGEASGNSAVRDFGKSYGLKAVVGARMRL